MLRFMLAEAVQHKVPKVGTLSMHVNLSLSETLFTILHKVWP